MQILVVVAIILSEIHRRLKWSRFPCEQYLDMGESVLTPEVNLLGKVCGSIRRGNSSDVFLDNGGKGIRTNIPKPVSFRGELRLVKQMTTAGRRVV